MCSLILESLPSLPQILHLFKEQLDIDDDKSNSDNNDDGDNDKIPAPYGV